MAAVSTGSVAVCSLCMAFAPVVQATSLLTAAISRNRDVPFRQCMRQAAKRDWEFREVLGRASPVCREGLQDFYCRRVAAVPQIRRSPPMTKYCQVESEELAPARVVTTEASLVSSRVVFFVLAAGYENNLLRLVRRLAAMAHHILVHIDVKRVEYFERAVAALRGAGSVDVISELRVNRGGVSTLNAWLLGMTWLLAHAGDWDYFINLNDSDYPITSLASLASFLWLNHGANFVNVGSAFKDCDCGRFLVYECGDELYSIAPETHYPRRPELHHASGPNLVTVSRRLAEYINTTRSRRGAPVQQIVEDLGILQQPDEKFFQTVMLNSPFCREHVRWSFHIWDRPGLKADDRSPEVAGPELKMLTPPLLSDAFVPRLAEVKQQRLAVFFARKFDNNRTAALQDAIDAATAVTADAPANDGGLERARVSAWRPLSRVDWLEALLESLLGPDAVVVAGTAAAWGWRPRSPSPSATGVDAAEELGGGPPTVSPARFRARVHMPCTRPPANAAHEEAGVDKSAGHEVTLHPHAAGARECGVAIARRAARCFGLVELEELGWRMAVAAAPPMSVLPALGGGLPLVGAVRVGAGWRPELMQFDGAVGLVPEADAGDVTAVIFWSHAWIAQRLPMAEEALEVVWRDAVGRRLRGRDGVVTANTMVSWVAPASRLAVTGEWTLELFLRGAMVSTRPFHICPAGACTGLPVEIVQRMRELEARKTNLDERVSSFKQQVSFLKLRCDSRKQQLEDDEHAQNLASQEAKIKQYGQNLHALTTFIRSKTAESNYEGEMVNCLSLADQLNKLHMERRVVPN